MTVHPVAVRPRWRLPSGNTGGGVEHEEPAATGLAWKAIAARRNRDRAAPAVRRTRRLPGETRTIDPPFRRGTQSRAALSTHQGPDSFRAHWKKGTTPCGRGRDEMPRLFKDALGYALERPHRGDPRQVRNSRKWRSPHETGSRPSTPHQGTSQTRIHPGRPSRGAASRGTRGQPPG